MYGNRIRICRDRIFYGMDLTFSSVLVVYEARRKVEYGRSFSQTVSMREERAGKRHNGVRSAGYRIFHDTLTTASYRVRTTYKNVVKRHYNRCVIVTKDVTHAPFMAESPHTSYSTLPVFTSCG